MLLNVPSRRGGVIGHGDVILAIEFSGQADMGAILPDAFITKNTECLEQFQTGDIARRPHAARTSSRTKCSRITLGMGPGMPSPK